MSCIHGIVDIDTDTSLSFKVMVALAREMLYVDFSFLLSSY